MKIQIPHRPIHIAFFLVLAFLCYQAHQVIRHLTGAVLCDGFGTMTFTVAATREPCSFPTILTLSGPVFTYGLAWLGIFLLRLPRVALFAYALIFASFAPLRWIQTLSGRGDELVLASQWFDISNRIAVAVIAFLMGLPPVVFAFRAIGNKRRVRVLMGSLLLPLPILIGLLFTNAWLFGREEITIPNGTLVFGISLTVFITDLIACLLLIFLSIRIHRRRDAANEKAKAHNESNHNRNSAPCHSSFCHGRTRHHSSHS